MRWLIKPLLLTLLLTASSCHTASGYTMTPKPPRQTQVSVDITSGLPPPSWRLAQAEIENLEQLLDTLAPVTSAPLFEGLGYRGFVITSAAPQRLIRVQGGYVQIEENGAQQTFADTDKRLEQWLVGMSQPHVEPQLYSFLKAAVGG